MFLIAGIALMVGYFLCSLMGSRYQSWAKGSAFLSSVLLTLAVGGVLLGSLLDFKEFYAGMSGLRIGGLLLLFVILTGYGMWEVKVRWEKLK